jgi:trk system potassium uptake protein TrkH
MSVQDSSSSSSNAQTSASQPNPTSPASPPPKRSRWAGWWQSVLARWSRLRPPQQLVLGFTSYVVIGTLLLALPWTQSQQARDAGGVSMLDNLFNVTSAVSTTGLTTISVADSYSWLGEFIILTLFQLGGIGYMTVSSIIVLARGQQLSSERTGILKSGFSLPRNFVIPLFLRHVIIFTVVIEAIGAALLWWRFSALGVDNALWSAIFHSVSAFSTAGFSLNNNSLESFRDDWVVNLVIAALCYLGAIGFIVLQDVWYSIKFREYMMTLTSKVILSMTLFVFVIGTLIFSFVEKSVMALPWDQRLLISAFQVMSASSTAGFNSVPFGGLGTAALFLIVVAMVIGASPAGTGGGIKTTTVSALLANLWAVIRGRDRVVWMGFEVPLPRVLTAVAAATLYLIMLAAGILMLAVSEPGKQFLSLFFEAASALGTVGLSMGITGELSAPGKVIIILLMFVGRCGPLTLGLALLEPRRDAHGRLPDDLAV